MQQKLNYSKVFTCSYFPQNFTGVGFPRSEYTLRESNDEEYTIPVIVTGGRLPVETVINVFTLEEGTAGLQLI